MAREKQTSFEKPAQRAAQPFNKDERQPPEAIEQFETIDCFSKHSYCFYQSFVAIPVLSIIQWL